MVYTVRLLNTARDSNAIHLQNTVTDGMPSMSQLLPRMAMPSLNTATDGHSIRRPVLLVDGTYRPLQEEIYHGPHKPDITQGAHIPFCS